MNTLIVRTTPVDVRWTLCGPGEEPGASGYLSRGQIDTGILAMEQIASEAGAINVARPDEEDQGIRHIDAVVFHAPYGGRVFDGPAVVDPNVLAQLESLIWEEPVHLPVIVELIDGCSKVLPSVPIVAAFDTAFFVQLPAWEYSYALGDIVTTDMPVRRFGHHGLHHQAAYNALREVAPENAGRALSICLDRRPEVAAIRNGVPLMVTGGETPLEGLPGERSCGDIDPSIVLTLAREKKWGIEQVNNVLTRESGLYGITGRPMSIRQALVGQDASSQLASLVLEYRLLLACGAGVAALEGLDAVVFSGGYHDAGEIICERLVRRLQRREMQNTPAPHAYCFRRMLSDILAEVGEKQLTTAVRPLDEVRPHPSAGRGLVLLK